MTEVGKLFVQGMITNEEEFEQVTGVRRASQFEWIVKDE